MDFEQVVATFPAARQVVHDLTIVALSASFTCDHPFEVEDAERLKSEYDRVRELIAYTFPDVSTEETGDPPLPDVLIEKYQSRCRKDP